MIETTVKRSERRCFEAICGENENILEKSKYRLLPQMLGSLAASLSAFNTGCLVGLPSSLIPQLEMEGDPRLRVSFSQASWLATLYLVAALPACLVGGYLSARFGRRQVTMVAGIPLFFTWCMIAVAPSIQIIFVARFISALAIGCTHPSVGVFVSEISHPDWRGSLGVTPSIFLAVGITKVYLLGFLFDWRTTSWICSAGSLLMVFSMWACRETPYWLVENQREEEARSSLQWYRGKGYDVTEEIDEIVQNKREKKDGGKHETNLCSLLTTIGSPAFLRPFSCAGSLYILAQWTGISTMVFFMTTIFQQSGSSIDPLLCPVIVAGIRVFTAGLAFFVLRYANRRYLFVFSSTIIFLSTSTIATFSYMNTSDCCFDSDTKDKIGMVPLLAVISMFVGHALGVVPVCQLTAAEVFPTEIRTLGSGICVAVATVANAVNSKIYPVLHAWLGFHGTFWLYSSIGLLMTITGACVIPDNRGISLVKIEDNMLRGSKTKS